MGIFDKGFKKTNRSFFERLSHAIVGRTEVDEDVLDAIEEALLATDMGVDTTLKLIENGQLVIIRNGIRYDVLGNTL